MATTNTDQRYGPTSGTLPGWLGLVVCAGLVLVLALEDPDVVQVRWIIVVAALAVVSWAFLLRPLITLRDRVLVLRNPLSTWTIPLATVDGVVVKAYTRVEAAGRSHDCVAVGRRVRKMIRGNRPDSGGGFGLGGFGGFRGDRAAHTAETVGRRPNASTPEALADLMVEQILNAASEARRRGDEAGPATRTWAVPELVLLTVGLLALAASFAF